jgi:hypothetical protein
MTNQSETTTSRRAFLAGVPVAAAALTPAVAAALSSGADDALVELGREHSKLVLQMRAAEDKTQPWHDLHNELMPKYLEESRKLENDDPRKMALYEALKKRIDDELGPWPHEADDVSSALDPIARQIMATPAISPIGLAVKARAALLACEGFWDTNAEDADWDYLHARSLIEAVLRFTGDRTSLQAMLEHRGTEANAGADTLDAADGKGGAI